VTSRERALGAGPGGAHWPRARWGGIHWAGSGSHSGSWDDQAIGRLCYAVLVVATLLPLAFARLPPFLDYYSHLTRIHIIAQLAQFEPFYRLNPTIPPNVAMDAILSGLTRLMPLPAAGWLFLVVTLVLQIGGVFVLNRRLFGPQATPAGPMIACVLVYNWVLSMGFLNYLFGIGLMLWLIAAWLAVRSRGWLPALGFGSVAGLLLLFTHAMAFALYAVIIGAWELQAAFEAFRRDRRNPLPTLLKGALPFLPALLLLAFLFKPEAEAEPPTWGTPFILQKVKAFVYALDSVSSSPILSGVGLALLVIVLAMTARMRLHRGVILPLAALVLVVLVAPRTLGGAANLDERLPVAIAFLGLAALRVEFRKSWGSTAFLGVLLVFAAWRSTDLILDFRNFRGHIQAAVNSFAGIEPGSIVAVAADQTSPDFSLHIRERRLWHISATAALHAPIFVATTHAMPSQHTIVVQPAFLPLYREQANMPWVVGTPHALRCTIYRYRQVATSAAGTPIGTTRYLVLLSPSVLAQAADRFGTVVEKTPDLLLIRIANDPQPDDEDACTGFHTNPGNNN
jgi:hypothetical protein